MAGLSDQERAAFEAIVKDAGDSEREQKDSWRRQVKLSCAVMVVGLVLCVVTFTFSLLGALAGLVLAFVGAYVALVTRLKYGSVVRDTEPRAPRVGILQRLADRGLLARVDIPEAPGGGSFGSLSAAGAVMRGTAHWDQGVSALTTFVGEFGNALVPADFTIDDFALGKWITLMRVARKLRALSDEQIGQLSELGMEWGFPRRV